MFYSYKNCKISINDNVVYANNMDISWGGNPEASYLVEKKYNEGYTPGNGINGSINFSYYLTGHDALVNNIIDETQSIKIEMGSMVINSGYLRRYSFNAIPNNPVFINAEIVFFDNITGVFTPKFETVDDLTFLNVGDVQIFSIPGNSIGRLNNITNLNYQYNIDINGQYSIGEIIPNRVVFGPKSVNVDISSDQIDGFISITGNRARLNITLVHPINTGIKQGFNCYGVLYQKRLDTSVNNILNSVYTIKQNDFTSFATANELSTKKPIIYSFSPSTGFYGELITVSGKNLSNITDVAFTENVFDRNYQIVNDNQLSITVPDGAVSGPITLYSNFGSINSQHSFLIGGLPISINSISPITGHIGSEILISGENFYEISRVLFNNISSEFSRLSSSLIAATVPNNCIWGKVNIISDAFLLSGQSLNEFVPIPKILGFNPLSGLSGEFILISGQGFSGISGIKFNNLPSNDFAPFSVTNNTGILTQVPSGNTRGFIKLFAQSGASALSTVNFYPYAKITGIIPTSGRTGDIITVSGINFFPEILFNLGSNLYAVSFEGDVTGFFKRNNNHSLSGAVPSGARSGIIHIYSPLFEEYPSEISFNVRHSIPIIQHILPSTGIIGDSISIIGTEFYDVNRVIITGQNTGIAISNNFSISNTNDFINFTIPQTITGGLYSVVVEANEGIASGNNLLRILEKPFISGFLPVSGGAGLLVSVSGRNFYPNITNIYIDNTGISALVDTGSFTGDFSRMRFFIPPNISSGLKNIIIGNRAGIITGLTKFNYIPNPVISGFSPLSGKWGNQILVTGQYFNTVYDIKIGEFPVTTYSIVNSTGIYLTLPETSTNYLKVTNIGGTTISNIPLVVVPPIVLISGFTPNPTYYNSGLFISGSYLNTVLQVVFSGLTGGEIISTSFSGIGTTGINMLVPQGITSGYIKLVNAAGQSYSNSILNLIPDPIISIIDLKTGVFKDLINVSGNNLSGSIFYFPSVNNKLIEADNLIRVADTGASFTVPQGIISGPITVKGRNNNFVSDTGSFVVLPTISGISGIGSYPTGEYVRITGINAFEARNFLGIYSIGAQFYNIAGNDFNIDNTFLTGIDNPKTGYSIFNIKLGGEFVGLGALFLLSSNDLSFTGAFEGTISHSLINDIILPSNKLISQPSPIITSFSPTGGNNITEILINGGHLLSTQQVKFTVGNITGSALITGITDTQVLVYPPTMITGTGFIILNTLIGTAITSPFKLLPRLYISGYNPTEAHTGVYVRISGSGLQSVTGVYFGQYLASFTGLSESNTYILSGIVPPDFDCCGETVEICVKNEGENYCL